MNVAIIPRIKENKMTALLSSIPFIRRINLAIILIKIKKQEIAENVKNIIDHILQYLMFFWLVLSMIFAFIHIIIVSVF